MPYQAADEVYIKPVTLIGVVEAVLILETSYQVKHDSDGIKAEYSESELAALPYFDKYIRGGFQFQIKATTWKHRRKLQVFARAVLSDGTFGRRVPIKRICPI